MSQLCLGVCELSVRVTDLSAAQRFHLCGMVWWNWLLKPTQPCKHPRQTKYPQTSNSALQIGSQWGALKRVRRHTDGPCEKHPDGSNIILECRATEHVFTIVTPHIGPVESHSMMFSIKCFHLVIMTRLSHCSQNHEHSYKSKLFKSPHNNNSILCTGWDTTKVYSLTFN